MAALRNVALVLVVTSLIASFGVEANLMQPVVNAPAASVESSVALESITPEQQTDALHRFEDELWLILTNTQYQWVIAIFVLVTGVVALWNGPSFFKMLVVLSTGALTASVVLSQLTQSPWTTALGSKMKFVASLECGLFVGYATYQGWKGTCQLLGLALGMYLYHSETVFVSAVVPLAGNNGTFVDDVTDVTNSAAWYTVMATLLVALGTWLLHETGGSVRMFGILAPLFGSSLIVAACGYLSALMLHVPDTSVVQFWFMITNPMQSQSIGYWTFHQKDYMDKLAGMCSWALLFVVGVVVQRKKFDEGTEVEQLQSKINQLETALLTADPLKTNNGKF